MRGEKKEKKINRLLEIPKEVYSNSPNIILTGFEEMVIENNKGILEYEDYYVRINTYIGIVDVHGLNLKLEKMTEDNLKITGKIERIGVYIRLINSFGRGMKKDADKATYKNNFWLC